MALATATVLSLIAAALFLARGGGDPVEVLVQARQAAAEAGSYRFTQSITGSNAAYLPGFSMEGAVDVSTQRSLMKLAAGGGNFPIDCTFISEGKSFYANVHPSRQAQVGASWVRAEAEGAGAFDTGSFRITPEDLFADPEGLFKNVKETGSSTIRGVRTTDYEADLYFGALLAKAGHTSPLPTEIQTVFPTKLSFDPEARLVRMTFELIPPTGTPDGFTIESTMDMYDYGKPLNIELPAGAKQVERTEAMTACYPSSIAANP